MYNALETAEQRSSFSAQGDVPHAFFLEYMQSLPCPFQQKGEPTDEELECLSTGERTKRKLASISDENKKNARWRKIKDVDGYNSTDMGKYLGELKVRSSIRSYRWKKLNNWRFSTCVGRPGIVVLFGTATPTDRRKTLAWWNNSLNMFGSEDKAYKHFSDSYRGRTYTHACAVTCREKGSATLWDTSRRKEAAYTAYNLHISLVKIFACYSFELI